MLVASSGVSDGETPMSRHTDNDRLYVCVLCDELLLEAALVGCSDAEGGHKGAV